MGFFSDIFNRTGRVARGQANQAVGALEDATFEATVQQTIRDMKTELNNVVRSSASAMSNYNQLDSEYQKWVRQAAEWKARAVQALDAGNEDLAKKALARKGECDKQVTSLQSAIDSARQASETLKSQVGELKRKIDDGERTANTLIARKNAASAQRKVSEALAGVGNADNAFATLATFEKSVAKEEATAKAFGELASAGKDDGLEAEFAALQGATVDSELEELKRERRIGSVHIQKELPPASGH
ncbi:MAG: PspA/IM30 family protein [Acidobacteriia bacterium]|jgi:phage shock protein A|nr:PspA/IM30 family protein [Terriglobia bacterium]